MTIPLDLTWIALAGSLATSVVLAVREWRARREAARLVATLPVTTVAVWEGDGVPGWD